MTNLWNTGDIITADKLNVTGNIFWVTLTATWDETVGAVYTSDKTVAEITTAYNNGKLPIAIRAENEEGTISDGAPRIVVPSYFGESEIYFSAASYDISEDTIGSVNAVFIMMQEGEGGDVIEVNAGSYEFPTNS